MSPEEMIAGATWDMEMNLGTFISAQAIPTYDPYATPYLKTRRSVSGDSHDTPLAISVIRDPNGLTEAVRLEKCHAVPTTSSSDETDRLLDSLYAILALCESTQPATDLFDPAYYMPQTDF